MEVDNSNSKIGINGRRRVQQRKYLLLKGLIACGSLAALTLAPLWETLLFSKYNFHHPQPGKNDYLSGLILIAVLVSVLGFIFYYLRYLSSFNRKYAGGVLLVIFLSPALNQIRSLLGQKLIPEFVATTIWFKIFPLLLGLGFLALARSSYLILWKFILLCFPFSLLIAAKLGLGCFNKSKGELTMVATHIGVPEKRLYNRVVWLIFDELDYRLTFPERPKQLLLPNFDRLADQSFNFTNAVPPARATIVSVPSLIDGVTYSVAYPTAPNRLMLGSSEGGIAPWGTRSNIFTDVSRMGGRCAVIGWYLPYSRIFRESVHLTHWVGFSSDSFIGRGGDLYSTVKVQLIGLTPIIRQILHGWNQIILEEELENIVGNQDYKLCFIHLPAPHLPKLAQEKVLTYMSDAESYFANLKVADRILGRCVDQIRNSPCAHNTTLIVSSDHSWRASKLYDNKADYRVPLIVHFAGQSRRTDLGPMVHTVNTRKLISEIIAKDTVINADLGKNILSVKISE
jgi:hypothetical protein